MVSNDKLEDLLDLHEALERLATFDARKSELVELVFFGGLTYEEASEVLNMPVTTIHRELKLTKAWLRSEIAGGAAG